MNLYFLDLISSCKVNIDPRRRKARKYLKVSDPRIRKGDLIRCKNNSLKLLIFDGKKIRQIDDNYCKPPPTIDKSIRVSHSLLPEHWSRFSILYFFLENNLQNKLRSSLVPISNNTLRGKIRIGKHKYYIEVSVTFSSLGPYKFVSKPRERWLMMD
jgi:hypothetical protein